MKLSVHILGREVATLESVGAFKSVMTYHPEIDPGDFVSLTMPVRTESYRWDAPLHPIFQMNLPEGYLLKVLQERFGPIIGSEPTALLSVVGRHMIGRIQVSAPGADLISIPQSFEVAEVLEGDNSEEAFAELVREHATSGVSGVIPKFLDETNMTIGIESFNKTTLFTGKYIVKGSSRNLPFAALNEHLCMQVASKVLPATRTEISRDGRALIVHRFDVDEQGHPRLGMEDFCCLLGLSPEKKYETTWERIAKAIRNHVPGPTQREAFRQLTLMLLLTHALRNADCHAKNLALIYSNKSDVRLSPAYDLLTTVVYPGYQHQPPAIAFMGKKTWASGKNLKNFIALEFGIPLREQGSMIESICEAITDSAPKVREAISEHPGFRDLGKHMLLAWEEGIQTLRDKRHYSLLLPENKNLLGEISNPPKLKSPKTILGQSDGLGKRRPESKE